MTIIVDLDHSLIRTESLKARMFALTRSFGVSRALWQRTYAATAERLAGRSSYSPLVHGKKIALGLGKPELSVKIANRLCAAILKTPDLVYNDAVKFLAQARQAGAKLILLTRGDLAWQKQKIAGAGLTKFFDRVIIAPEDKRIILKRRLRLGSPAYIITDNADEVRRLRGLPLKIIQLIRPDGKYQKRVKRIPAVSNLSQAWQIIKHNK